MRSYFTHHGENMKPDKGRGFVNFLGKKQGEVWKEKGPDNMGHIKTDGAKDGHCKIEASKEMRAIWTPPRAYGEKWQYSCAH